MSSLDKVDHSTAFLPASLFTRFYDKAAQPYNLHPILHEEHGHGLLEHEYIFVPVARPGHWDSQWTDRTRPTIKYLDSYCQGGAIYANAMRTYLNDFELTNGQKQQKPWTCIDITHRQSYKNATHVYILRQLYLCINLRRSNKSEALKKQRGVVMGRKGKGTAAVEKRYHRTTPDLLKSTRLDDQTAYTGGIEKHCAGKDKVEGVDTHNKPRRSCWEK